MNDVSRSTLRMEKMVPICVIALALAAAFNAVDALPVGVFYDDALYTILGKALASGDGYRYLNIPGRPLATHYPPGYPLLLAVLWKVSPTFPANVAVFKAVNAMLVGVVAFLTYDFARERFRCSAIAAGAVALVGAAAIPTLVLSSAVMSEMMFLALLLPWLRAAERSLTVTGPRPIVLAASGAALFYVRAHAIVIVPALVVAQLIARRRRDALSSVAVGIAVVVPWFLWVAAHDAALAEPLRGAYGSYGAWLARGLRTTGAPMLVAALHDNIATTAAIIGRSFGISQRPPFPTIAMVAVTVLAVAGALSLYARARVTLLFLLFYMATVLVWPFSPLRFIWGIWPLVVLLLFAGGRLLASERALGRRSRAIRWAGVTASAFACAGLLVFNVRGYANAWWTTVSRSVTPRIQPQLEWVVTRTDSAAVVAADDEGAVYLYTGRRAVPANVFTAAQYFGQRPVTEDAANLRAIILQLRPDYVVAWADPTVAAAERLTRTRPPVLARFDTIRGGRAYRPTR